MTGNRERILTGMLEAVGRQGYERATVQDAIEAGFAWVELSMREAATGQTGWRAQLRGALSGLLDFLDERPAVGRALLVEVHAAGPRAVEKRTEALELAATMMDLAREESGASAPEISAEAVVAGILAVLHTRLSNERPPNFSRLLPELMYLAVLPFFGPDAAAAELQPEEL